ncbi:MAG: alpha-1,2-fucosyltransferase [Lachnospiraceae bacterium]|nr:alpha-1,2-fucosyltransferase [Lachnospiraceae bacterium]
MINTEYKHDYENIIQKAYRIVHNLFYKCIKDKKRAYPLYASYRHRKKLVKDSKNVIQYMSQKPSYNAGFGHGIDIWRNGIINSEMFHLRYAYMPMVSSEWEDSLGFSENETEVGSLKLKGYRQILLPYYDPNEKWSVDLIREIIKSYKGEKIIFLNEMEQQSKKDHFMIGADYMRRKFWESSKRRNDRLLYNKGEISVAVHIRRGDVSEGIKKGNEKLKKRWLDEDYYISLMGKILGFGSTDNIRFYIFSEGNKEDFSKINMFNGDVEFCLDMSPIDSFIHMCRADLLIVGLSSFSYDPGLINKSLKIASDRFWNPYPDNGEWIIADKFGMIEKDKEDILKNYLTEIAEGKKY